MKYTIRLLTVISVLLSLIWLLGIGWTINKYYAAKPDKIPTVRRNATVAENKNEIKMVALGDSLTKGLGDDTGKGYAGDILDEVKKRTKKKVSLENLAISGQTSAQLKLQVVQPEVQRQLSGANVILVTIGGNDLFRGGQGMADYNSKHITIIENQYLVNLQFIFRQIRRANSNAEIFFVGLYNPFIDLSNGKDTSKVVRKWNYDSAELSADFPKIVFVPTFDLFELNVNDYLYTDKFHPNTKGYRLIAERVAALLTW